jgi:hypothetical protein
MIMFIYANVWPEYTKIFFHLASFNPYATFTVITNLSRIDHIPPNVVLKHVSRDQLEHRAQNALNFSVSITSGYKLCDYRPLFAKMFEDYLTGYTHWGWCDFDIILGNLREAITKNYNGEDIICSAYPELVANGPLTLFKNNDKIRDHYMNLNQEQLKTQLSHPEPAFLEERLFSRSVQSNSSIRFLGKHLDCQWVTWIWYNGDMKSLQQDCLISHFGGFSSEVSAAQKRHVVNELADFFRQNYNRKGNYGFGRWRVYKKRPHDTRFFYFNITLDSQSSPPVEVINLIKHGSVSEMSAEVFAESQEIVRRIWQKWK